MREQKRSVYIVLPGLVLAVVFLSGCGKSVSQSVNETAAEKIIEAQSGGKAQVDIDNQNIKVVTEQGTMESGENIKLPADFPTDVFIIEGNIKAAIADTENQGQTVVIETGKDVTEVSTIYQEKMIADGWQITNTMNLGEAVTLMGEKGDRVLSIIIGKSEDKTIVNLSIGKQ